MISRSIKPYGFRLYRDEKRLSVERLPGMGCAEQSFGFGRGMHTWSSVEDAKYQTGVMVVIKERRSGAIKSLKP